MVLVKPDFKSIFDSQPSFFNRLISSTFLGAPSGIFLFQKISPSNFTMLAIFFANSFIEISFPVPTLRYSKGLPYMSFQPKG